MNSGTGIGVRSASTMTRDSGRGCGPATLNTPSQGRFASVTAMASTTSSSCMNWKKGSKPRTMGTCLPMMKLASVPCPLGRACTDRRSTSGCQLGKRPEGRAGVEVGRDEVG